jgi:diguanylate cyclase (GGDEF)-like protein
VNQLAIDLDHRIAAMREWDIFRVIADPEAARLQAADVLSFAQSHRADLLTAHALLVLGGAEVFSSGIALAEEHLLEAERLFREVGDEWGELSAILRQNVIWGYREQVNLSLSRLPAILERARILGDERLIIGILSDLGVQLRRALQFERGFLASIEAHERAVRLGDRHYLFLTKLNLIEPLIALHDLGAARQLCQDCADLIQESDRVFHADVEMSLGTCDAGQGDLASAIEHFQAAMASAQDVNDPFTIALAHFEWGKVFAQIGDTDQARLVFQRALALWEAMDGLENSVRVALTRWWLESLAGAFTRSTLTDLRNAIVHASSEPILLVEELYDAVVVAAEALGEIALALQFAREGNARQREYWQALAAYSSQRIARELQVDRALQSAETERQRRREAIARSERSEALVEALRQESDALKILASLDGLTGVANRREFDRQLDLAWNQRSEHRPWLSVMLLDVDDFKTINDRFSHLVGDDVLRAIGRLLLQEDPAVDLAGRYGGEEFGVILATRAPDEAMRAAEALHGKIQQHPWAVHHEDLAVTASIGMASISRAYAGSSALDLMPFLDVVDEMLYRAKRDGKNLIRHTIFHKPGASGDDR